MYIDLVVVIILLLLVLFFFRRFSSFVYAVAIIDIFFRIVTFLKDNVPVPELKVLIGKYSSGIFYTILMWIFVFIYMCFLFYVTRTFIHKKK